MWAVFLRGHAGDDLRVDRVNRPPEHVERPALTMAVVVQPEVIAGLASKPGFRGRGLLGRILFSLPFSLIGYRELIHRRLHVPFAMTTSSACGHFCDSLLERIEMDVPSHTA